MPTPAERKALLFVAALAALGVSARAYRAVRTAAPDAGSRRALDGQIAAVDSAVARRAAARSARESAARSATWGARGSSAGTQRSSGGARSTEPGRPATPPARTGLEIAEERRLAVERSNAEARARVAAHLGIAPPPAPDRSLPGRQVTQRQSGDAPPPGPVDLDTAPAGEIATVPGIGPTLARRIVSDRTERGAFGSLAGLQRVKGIGPGLAARIRSSVTFSRPLSAPPVVLQFRRPSAPRNRP